MLKLYVWKAVLSEYSSGIAFALAETPEDAKAELIKRGLPEFYFVGTSIQTEDQLVAPVVYTRPVGIFLFGGH